MTYSERERAIDRLLLRLEAEANAHPRGVKATIRRTESKALRSVRHAWDTSLLPDDMKGEQIPPPTEKSYTYRATKMNRFGEAER